MLKIFNKEQLKKIDEFTINHQPIASIDLMEQAAVACVEWICKRFNKEQSFGIFCGQGNNGGDGLAIARLLINKNYNVTVYVNASEKYYSADYLINLSRLQKITNKIVDVAEQFDIKIFEHDVIIDALFGYGLNKPISNWVKEVIKVINNAQKVVVAIDLPSGLFCNDNRNNDFQTIVKANYTLTFEFPKLSFLLPQTGNFVGEFVLLNIGLSKEAVDNESTYFYFVERKDIVPLVHKRQKFSHKGNFGHALLLAGSAGKGGAAVLATKSCLRTGVGLLTVQTPQILYTILQSTCPEAMTIVDENEFYLSTLLKDYTQFDAIAIGPGIGTENTTAQLLKQIIQQSKKPIIFDADAINILANNKTWLAFLPPLSILTPHLKEFERLTYKTNSDVERLEVLRNFCQTNNCYVVLKGAFSAIGTPKGNVYFNSTGNPGMAKGGMGDALTGMILAMLAQGYDSFEALLIAVYLHGLAGDIALEYIHEQSLLPSDLIDNIGNAFFKVSS